MTEHENANNWTSRQLEFMAWLATPKNDRNPKTQVLFAKHIKADPATLSDWKKLPGFQAEVIKLCRSLVKDSLPDIYGALTDKAIEGDVPAIKLVMEMIGEYTPGQRIELNASVSWRDLVEQSRTDDEG